MTDASLKPHLLITGAPGCGKTTALRRAAEQLANLRPGGFYTEEMRTGGERVGFRLVAFGGGTEVIAHVDFPKTWRVGKYGVDAAALDRAAQATLAPGGGAALYFVDEIGKMECLSTRFVELMRRLLDSGAPLVATVALHGAGLIAEVKQRADCELWTLSRADRDAIPARIVVWAAERGFAAGEKHAGAANGPARQSR